MVKLKSVQYELNHIYNKVISSGYIAVGQNAAQGTGELELFQKSLALASDLKQLPVLRSLYGCFRFGADINGSLVASGVNQIQGTISIYDGDIEEDNLIAAYNMVYHYSNVSGHAFFVKDDIEWTLKGGKILNDTLNFTFDTNANQNVAGAAVSGGLIQGMLFLEIDWTPINKAELTDYMIEQLYIDN